MYNINKHLHSPHLFYLCLFFLQKKKKVFKRRCSDEMMFHNSWREKVLPYLFRLILRYISGLFSLFSSVLLRSAGRRRKLDLQKNFGKLVSTEVTSMLLGFCAIFNICVFSHFNKIKISCSWYIDKISCKLNIFNWFEYLCHSSFGWYWCRLVQTPEGQSALKWLRK